MVVSKGLATWSRANYEVSPGFLVYCVASRKLTLANKGGGQDLPQSDISCNRPNVSIDHLGQTVTATAYFGLASVSFLNRLSSRP